MEEKGGIPQFGNPALRIRHSMSHLDTEIAPTVTSRLDSSTTHPAVPRRRCPLCQNLPFALVLPWEPLS